MADRPLAGRVALVTGANHGIGAAVAVALAERGADVAITYLRDRTIADGEVHHTDDYLGPRRRDGSDVRLAIEALGRRGATFEADLRDDDVPGRVFDQAEDALGPVAVLVHNASGWQRDSFAAATHDANRRSLAPVTPASIDAQLLVDARAGALLLQQFIARHRARGGDWGRIVTMTSGEGRAFPGEVSYGAAKAALISYTLSAASEMAADGVTANVVYPPVTDTGWITDDVRAFVAADDDHHHIATPAEVAETVAWLCAEANHLVTGNIIRLR
jgi:3-oxoacyl-[acyl-carrier protein] reductase